jgi:hypothetical protein
MQPRRRRPPATDGNRRGRKPTEARHGASQCAGAPGRAGAHGPGPARARAANATGRRSWLAGSAPHTQPQIPPSAPDGECRPRRWSASEPAAAAASRSAVCLEPGASVAAPLFSFLPRLPFLPFLLPAALGGAGAAAVAPATGAAAAAPGGDRPQLSSAAKSPVRADWRTRSWISFHLPTHCGVVKSLQPVISPHCALEWTSW